MIRPIIWVTLLTVGMVSVVHSQPPALGPAPKILLVDAVTPDQGIVAIAVEKTVTEVVPVVVEEKVIVNGMEMIVARTVLQTVSKVVQVKQAWNAGANKAFDSSGQPLTKEEVFKRLKAGDAVLVVPAGQKLAQAFLRLLSKDAVILESAGAGF